MHHACRAVELVQEEFLRVQEEHEALEPLTRGAENEALVGGLEVWL